MFDSETRAAAQNFAQRLGCEAAVLLAVIEIESGGRVFARVSGRNEPLIRFEGHYFDRRLTGAAREQARFLDLAHPTAGVVRNPAGQAARWAMVERAAEIDATAAFESTSFGVGQVMGAHWDRLGFGHVDELVNLARSGVAGQIELVVRYIEMAGLAGALVRRDWAAFARGYNGPAYARHGYHTKLAAAYLRQGGDFPKAPSAAGMLRLGSKGARVRELQQLLTRAGHTLRIDGDFGPATHDAVRQFQQRADLEVDGVAGPQTMRALDRFRQGTGDRPGEQPVTDIREVRDGVAGGFGGGLATEVARQQVAEAADRVAYLPGLEWLSAALAVLAVGLVVAGLTYAVHGWWTARRTVEAPQ